jgi:hypothetical protein
MFHTYVASVSYGCCICFAMATDVFSWCFRRMLQVFHLDVVKVDLVLHMLQWNLSAVAAHACACDGARAVGAGNDVGTDQDALPSGRAQMRETERRRPSREAGAGVQVSAAACVRGDVGRCSRHRRQLDYH